VRRIVGRHELDSVEGRAAAVADVLPILETLSDPVRRSEYGHQLAELAGVSEASVMQSLDSRLGGHPKEVAKAIKRTSAQEKVEREALKLLVRDADTYRELAAKLTEDHFQSSSNRRLFEALIEAEGDVSALAGGADEKLAAAISALALEPLKGELTTEYMESVWGRLQMFLLEGRSDALRLRVQKLNPTKDPDYEGLFRELVAVDGDLLRLRQGLHDVV
jgi:DNA primase